MPAILSLAIAAMISAGPFSHGADKAASVPQIEYISPDGQLSSLSATDHPHRSSTAAFVDNDTVSCALREGDTTFIIALPNRSPHDRFTFLNENASACGELKIAVSNAPLPADSSDWIEVDGIVPFTHTRLFKLSMLGVDTKFVRLSFRVENPHRRNAEQDTARISDPFRCSVLLESINPNIVRLHRDRVDVSFATLSVAPLPATSK